MAELTPEEREARELQLAALLRSEWREMWAQQMALEKLTDSEMARQMRDLDASRHWLRWWALTFVEVLGCALVATLLERVGQPPMRTFVLLLGGVLIINVGLAAIWRQL